MRFGLGLGPPYTLTSNDVSLPDCAQVWVWAENCLVRGFSPTQGRQGSMVHMGFPVSGVFLTPVSVLNYSHQQKNMASFFFCAEVTASLMRLKFNFPFSNNNFHLKLYVVALMVFKPAHVSESPGCAFWRCRFLVCLPDLLRNLKHLTRMSQESAFKKFS